MANAFWIVSALAVSCAAQTAPAPTANDWRIVPGERVGPVTARTTRADLPRAFAGDAIKDEEIELAEGVLQPATLVSDLAIVWTSKKPDAHPARIFVCRGAARRRCRWQAAEGITIGTRLQRLEQLNGRPFSIAGFGFDYGGNVLSWEGGGLAALDCPPRLILTLDGDRSRDGRLAVDLTSDERHSITGDRAVSSDAPAMRKINPAVTEMVVDFSGSQDCGSR